MSANLGLDMNVGKEGCGCGADGVNYEALIIGFGAYTV